MRAMARGAAHVSACEADLTTKGRMDGPLHDILQSGRAIMGRESGRTELPEGWMICRTGVQRMLVYLVTTTVHNLQDMTVIVRGVSGVLFYPLVFIPCGMLGR